MRNVQAIKLALRVLAVSLLGIDTQAQTLLYYWNFNNSSGSRGTLSTPPAYADTADGYTGGTFVVVSTATAGLATPTGSGLSNAWASTPADLALVNPTAYRSHAGVYQAPIGSLGAISSSFTVSLWF